MNIELDSIPLIHRIWRFIIHFPIGFVAVWSGMAGSIAITGGFLIYELNQDRYKKDRAYRDIVGFIAGAITAGVFYA